MRAKFPSQYLGFYYHVRSQCMFYISYMFLYFETRALQRQLENRGQIWYFLILCKH